jgi:hypothetical protein
MSGDRSAWMQNLAAARIDYVCVFALNPYEINYVAHNAGGFPIEDDWARSRPSAFRVVFENPDARIYAVTLE